MRLLFRGHARTACLLLLPFLSLATPAHGASIDLTIGTAMVEIDGRSVPKMVVNGGLPGPTLRLREGEDATITVTNRTDAVTSVHWHGLLLPGMMDGAPGFNGFLGIRPGEAFTYTFPVRQSGTYWYHSHSGTQDQSVLGALVIDPAVPDTVLADRDHVVLLGDATPEDSDQVLANLKGNAAHYRVAGRTLFDLIADIGRDGAGAAMRDRMAWGAMRMDPTDLADVTGYTFLANGKDPHANETFVFRRGERLRLRLINGSAMTFFDVRIPGLRMSVVAADGNDVEPVMVDELRIGVAERYDVIVEPDGPGPWTLVAESLDRTGFARVTLATTPGQAGPVPAMRPRALLTMADMGSAHADHAGHTDHAGHAGHEHARPSGWASGFPADARVLAYADLKARVPNIDTGEPVRTITVRLTGNMERYVWSLNDRKFDQAEPLRVRFGERVRLTFVNETMMAHPVHLHGQFFQVENGQSDRKPLKDTVIVAPGAAVSVVLTAREVGSWPLHCHLLYHMEAGMMTRFVVGPPTAMGDPTPHGDTVILTTHEGHGDGHAHHEASGHGDHGAHGAAR